MTRSECIRALQAQYAARRAQNDAETDARIAQACARDPEIARLREENRTLAFETLREIMALDDQDARERAARRMKETGVRNNAEVRARLTALGLPEDELETHYACPVCRDTGMVGDAPSRFCDCFEAALRRMMYEDGSMAGVEEQCFDKFCAERIPEENGQRENLVLRREVCEDYADSLPNSKFLNLLLTGSGGLGKTFLLNCIYERAVSRGVSAVRITAFRMFEAMRRQHFANSAEEMEFDRLLSVPLLLIDDLGSEPMMRNITVEYLFTLLNERIAARRHTVIATNLSPVQLYETYGERVGSRLCDRTNCATLLFTGKDLRKL